MLKTHFSCTGGVLEMTSCESCDFKTHFKVVLHNHVSQNHKKQKCVPNFMEILKSYVCRQCGKQTYSLLVLTSHKCSKKSDEEKCDQPEQHCTPKEKTKWFECEHCAYKSKQKFALQRHIIAKHMTKKAQDAVKQFKCDHCAFRAILKSELNRHIVNAHEPEDIQWFQCDHCTYKGKKEVFLKMHLLSKHDYQYI